MNDLTISVVSHGHGEHLRNLLADLNRIGERARLMVVLTFNIPELEPQETDYPNLCFFIIRNEFPRGFGANHNAAFERCHTQWFAILNPDLRLPENPFEVLLTRGATAPDIGVVSPRVVNPAGIDEDHIRRNLTPASLWRRHRGIAEPVVASTVAQRPGKFYWLAGMFLMFNSAPFRQIGGFDERFFLYCEDYDICSRLYSAGFAVKLIPQTHVVHDAQRDSHRSLRHLRWHVASLCKVWFSRAFWKLTFGG